MHFKNNLSLTDHSGRTYESLFQEMKHDHSMSIVNATCGFVVDNCNKNIRMSGQHGVITDAPIPMYQHISYLWAIQKTLFLVGMCGMQSTIALPAITTLGKSKGWV